MTLACALGTWALIAAGFSAVTLWRLRRRSPPPSLSTWPPVLLLRPLDAPSSAELLALSEPIDYRGPLEHVVLTPQRLELPAGVRWLPSDPLTGNRKVGHLLYGVAALGAPGRIVVAVDGDVCVDGALLEALVTPVVEGAALTWAAPQPERGRTLSSRAVRGLLARGHHAFEALAVMTAGAPAICGKAIALGPQALDLLPEVAGCIGEDLELSSRLTAKGARVVAAAAPAKTLADRGTLGAALERFTRWMQVLRAHRPALFPSIPLLFAPTAPLIIAALISRSGAVWAAVATLIIARLALSLRLAQRGNAKLISASFEWLLGELLLLTAFIVSLAARRVTWRGRVFTLERGGQLRALPGPARLSAP